MPGKRNKWVDGALSLTWALSYAILIQSPDSFAYLYMTMRGCMPFNAVRKNAGAARRRAICLATRAVAIMCVEDSPLKRNTPYVPSDKQEPRSRPLKTGARHGSASGNADR